MKLQGKVAIITGSGSGIGRATALLFAREGASVIVADISEEGGTETIRRIREDGGEATFVHTDVSAAADCQALINTTVETYGKLDILHNNAYWARPGSPILDVTEEEWDRTIDTTLKSVFLCCKAALPEMLRRGGGVIVNTASVAGLVASPKFSAYMAAKGGVVQLTKSIACDYGRQGIRVNAICPGPVLTPATADLMLQPEWRENMARQSLVGRFGEPEDVAHAALYLASDESAYVQGSLLVVDGGRTAL